MKKFFSKVNKILIASILFAQLNVAFAQYVSNDKFNFISVCTKHGIIKVPIVSQSSTEKTYNSAKVMNCCLDIQSNFIFSKINDISAETTLFSSVVININDLDQSYNYNFSLIRAPPNFTKS